MAVTGTVALGVLSSGLWAAVGAVGVGISSQIYRHWSTRRPLQRLLLRNPKRSVLVIQSAVISHDESEYFKYLVTPDCVTGYYYLHERLRDVGYQSDKIYVRFPAELTPDGLASHDLILIGGYENNDISADISSYNQPAYLKDNKIYIKGRHDPFDIELSGGRVKKDYCLISRRPNPYSNGNPEDCWIVGFEGIRHYGTEAGIRFLTAKNLRNPIFSKAHKAKEIYIVVSCGVTHVSDNSYSLKEIRIEYAWIDGRPYEPHSKNDA